MLFSTFREELSVNETFPVLSVTIGKARVDSDLCL